MNTNEIVGQSGGSGQATLEEIDTVCREVLSERYEGPRDLKAEGRRGLVDWFAVTFPIAVEQECICDMLGKSGWAPINHSMLRYPVGVKRGSVYVLWHPERPDMGIHVRASGEGCRELEALGVVGDEGGKARYTWREFLGLMRLLGGKFTRVDLALDDFEGRITEEGILSAIKEGRVSSRFETARPVKGDIDLTTGETEEGWTIYFGKRVSEGFVRIYDKTTEERKQLADRGERGQVPNEWVRVELELKRDRACRMVDRIVEEGFGVVAQVLLSYLDFKERHTDTNKSRWETVAWWASFLETVEKAKLGSAPVSRSLERCRAYLSRQVAPTLALLVEAYEGRTDWLEELITDGSKRFGVWHKELLRRTLLRLETGRAILRDMEGRVWVQGDRFTERRVSGLGVVIT